MAAKRAYRSRPQTSPQSTGVDSEVPHAPSEPRACIFPKGPDGLCDYHRALFALREQQDIAAQNSKLLYVIIHKGTSPPRHPNQ